MKITLNLATRPYADQGPALKNLRIGMAVLAGMLVLLGLGWMQVHQTALKMAAQQAAVDESIAQIGREQRGYEAQMQQPANARVLKQAVFLNQLFEEKSFSWTAAMEDLERVLPGGVQVTAIEPARGKDGRLTLRLRISGLRERSVEMVRNMERSRRFVDPRVAGENAESGNSQGDLQPVGVPSKVSFDILAEYNPATLEERKAEIGAQRQKRAAVVSNGAGNPVSRPLPLARPKRVLFPTAGQKPGYVPPNPQPRMVPRQNVPPGAMGGPTDGQQMPTGIDPSGLKNHELNRFPRPGDVPPGYVSNQPGNQPGGPQ